MSTLSGFEMILQYVEILLMGWNGGSSYKEEKLKPLYIYFVQSWKKNKYPLLTPQQSIEKKLLLQND